MKIVSRYQNFETAIDREQIRERFQTELKKRFGNDTEIIDLFVTRVFPRKEGGFTIQYELRLKRPDRKDKGQLLLCGHLLGPGEKWPSYVEKKRGDYFVMEDIGLVTPVFPFDPKLPSLEILTQTKDKSPVFKGLESALGKKIKITDMKIMGYRLEKRCVIRYDLEIKEGLSGTRKIVAKAYRSSRFAGILKSIEALENKGFDHDSPNGLTVPRIMEIDPELSVIFMENAPGFSLHYLMEKDIFDKACFAAGGMLRKLHSLNADGLKNHSKSDELGNLRKLSELLKNMYPETEDTFSKELNSLEKIVGDEYSKNAFSHRDFFDKQILYSENRTTLLDYENAGAADPALDIGNFLAHMSLRSLQHPRCSDNIRNGSKAFLDAYGNFEEGFLSRVAWWSRASRLRLGALYLLRPRWRELAYKLLTQPINILGQQAPGGINEK
jgi:hypothetical protein